MAVEVAEEEYLSRLLSLFHHEFSVVVDGVEFGTAADPLAIEVLANQRAPVVAYYYSVRVQHRNNFEHIIVSQELSFFIVTYQELYHSLHHPAGIRFSRVDSCGEDDCLSYSYVLGDAAEVGHDKHVYIVSRKRLAEDCLPDFVFVLVGANRVDELADV
jgi:hypothetical protein